ncbi:MAG: aminotransferase class I/II-fold pyridoxal phosphate-dependent enzyme, partial [Deltaproteobacteria bacterium]|nr:aminotransferase class I/II-fold pyridoxal phosphate-dependent enzyme [Deltaproteobacteria bacterium]
MTSFKYLNIEAVDRAGTYCEKYDSLKEYFGSSDLFPLWVADMDLATPSFVVDAVKDRAANPLYGYTKKYDEIFDAIKFWMNSEHGVILDKEHISLSPSVQTTILNGIRGLSKKGDTVLIFSPVYGPFFSAVKNLERRVADFPLDVINNRFEIDFNRLETVIKKDKPAILLFCSPHNPGG